MNRKIKKVSRFQSFLLYKSLETKQEYEQIKYNVSYQNKLELNILKAVEACAYQTDKKIIKYYTKVSDESVTIEKKLATQHINENNTISHNFTRTTNSGEQVSIRYKEAWNDESKLNMFMNNLYPELKKSNNTENAKRLSSYIYATEHDDKGADIQEAILKGINYIKNTVALQMYDISDVIALDKDNHGNTEREMEQLERFRKEIRQFFGEDNIFIEEESCAKGLHAYIKLKQAVSSTVKKKIVEAFRVQYGYEKNEVEMPHVIRMFGSFNYRLINVETDFYFTSMHDAIKSVTERKEKAMGFDATPFKQRRKAKIETTQEIIAPVKPKPIENAYMKRKNSKGVSKESVISELMHDSKYKITDGNRIEITKLAIRDTYLLGLTSDDVYQCLSSNGSTSVDIRDWQGTNNFQKSVEYFWNYWNVNSVLKPFDIKKTSKPEEHISNTHFVPDDIQKKFNQKHILAYECKKAGYKNKEQNRKAISVCLLEAFGKALYNPSNQVEVKQGMNPKYAEGFSISEAECILMKKANPEIFKDINPTTMMRKVLNKSGYFYKHVRHFHSNIASFNKVTQWNIIDNTHLHYNNISIIMDSIYKSIDKVLLSFSYVKKLYNKYISKLIKKQKIYLYIVVQNILDIKNIGVRIAPEWSPG